MYRIGKHHHTRFKRAVWTIIALSIVLGIGAGVYFAYKIFTTTETTATLPAAVVHEFAPPATADRLFDEEHFAIRLPEDWQLKSSGNTGRYNIYSFQATQKHKDNRWLEVYVDRVPTNMSFNRLLPVYIHENRFVVASSVSDNCMDLTEQKATNSAAEETVQLKWQGVSFTCDITNNLRNVVGVGSSENGQNLPLVSSSGVKHVFYFVYIDHNISPDYQILERAIESFEPK